MIWNKFKVGKKGYVPSHEFPQGLMPCGWGVTSTQMVVVTGKYFNISIILVLIALIITVNDFISLLSPYRFNSWIFYLWKSLVEKIFGGNAERETPASPLNDGRRFVPLPAWKIFLIQFLEYSRPGAQFPASAVPCSVLPLFMIVNGQQFFAGAVTWLFFRYRFPRSKWRSEYVARCR